MSTKGAILKRKSYRVLLEELIDLAVRIKENYKEPLYVQWDSERAAILLEELKRRDDEAKAEAGQSPNV